MAYTYSGMRMIDWGEVKRIHETTGLCGYYKLYPDKDIETMIEEDYEWSDVESHHDCGGEFGEEIDFCNTTAETIK